LSVTTSSTAPPGSYPLTVTGASGAATHSVEVILVIERRATSPSR
jgi:hypothetical protein